MSPHLRLIALLLPICLLSCATPYKEHGLFGGYRDTAIDTNHYLVTFDGNGKTPRDRVFAYWAYRCAELTKEKGFTHFTLAQAQAPRPAATSRAAARSGKTPSIPAAKAVSSLSIIAAEAAAT